MHGVDPPVTRAFGITFDYRCPFGRIAHDHVVAGLQAGADWKVDFLPFCLGQAHVEEGMTDVWDAPETDSGLLAIQVALSVRDRQPDRFLAVHRAIFDHRHDGGGSLRDRGALAAVLGSVGADADAAFTDVDSGRTLTVARDEHQRWVRSHQVWGTPTFIVGDAAVFVRLMEKSRDGADSVRVVERILDTIDWPILNEFKHTSVPA